MAKYYVECGEIKDVLNSSSHMNACICSVIRCMKDNMENGKDQSCDLTKIFIVNERGFVSERDSYKMDSSSEQFIDTDRVFEELNKI